ncbi:MAG: aminopeptidase P family protein [Phycisphaerae bacterium]
MTESKYSHRRARALRAAVRDAKRGLDAFLVSKVEDVGYLSGFTGDDSLLLVARGWACLLTDGRYDEQARAECPGVDVFVRKVGMPEAVAYVVKTLRIANCELRIPAEGAKEPNEGKFTIHNPQFTIRIRRLAVQADHFTIRAGEAYAKALGGGVRLIPVGDVTGALRQVKDDGEVRQIRKAIAAAQGAFKALLAQGAGAFVGRTERQVAAELDYRMRLAGADKPSFDTIVAAGPHASLPHYRPGGTRITRGTPVLIDWGAFVGGYCSDLTRVVFPGRIPPKLAEIYPIVQRAQKAGMAAVRAGASARAVDAAARSVIKKAGYDKEFVHGLGHGIGRQIHELPGVGRLAKVRLKAGMVVTVEPGIYLPGVGGVRIEDDVLVCPQGHERLSSLPTALEAMTVR